MTVLTEAEVIGGRCLTLAKAFHEHASTVVLALNALMDAQNAKDVLQYAAAMGALLHAKAQAELFVLRHWQE